MAIEDMVVYKRAEQLMFRTYKPIKNYPKAEKFCLAQETKLNLELNENKTKIFPIAQGVNAIGFKIYATHMLLRNDSKKKIKRKLKKFRPMLIEEKITIEKVEQILNSWHGHAELADSYKFIQSLLNRFDYIELTDKIKNGKKKKVFKVKRGVIENERKIRALSA